MQDKIQFQGVQLDFKVRIFSGDGPARQFEAGQQRGGNYSCICGVDSKSHSNLERCFKIKPMDLEERRQVVMTGSSWNKIKEGNINPFSRLRKEELVDELEDRGIDTF